jgi:hypothetical protein
MEPVTPNPETEWLSEAPALQRALNLMETLPTGHQQVLALAIINEVRSQRVTLAPDDTGVRNLGLKKIASLMDPKYRERWYNKDSQVQKAINDLFTMPKDFLNIAGMKLLLCMQAFDEYARQNELPADQIHRLQVHALVKAVFDRSLEEIRESARQREEALQKVEIEDKTNVVSSREGMKIKGTLF